MTVIAWDGHTLAADRQATDGAGFTAAVRKIFRVPGRAELLAMTGRADLSNPLRAWYESGAVPDQFPAVARCGTASVYVFGANGVRAYSGDPIPENLEGDRLAFGSGGACAAGALHVGATALQAVEAACAHMSCCGRGIDFLALGDVAKPPEDLRGLPRKNAQIPTNFGKARCPKT